MAKFAGTLVTRSEHPLRLIDFFSNINDLQYIAIKTQADYVPEDFPNIYAVGKDIDLIISPSDFNEAIQRLRQFSKNYHTFKRREVTTEGDFRLRFQERDKLHFQIHLSTEFLGASHEFLRQAIASRLPVNGYYTPSLAFELVFHMLEYYVNRNKQHHLAFIKQHADSTDWRLVSPMELRKFYRDLLVIDA